MEMRRSVSVTSEDREGGIVEIKCRMKYSKQFGKAFIFLFSVLFFFGFFNQESSASTSNPTTRAECEINEDRYCAYTCLGGGWKSIGTCSDVTSSTECCSREVSDVACSSTDCGNGVKGVCKPECASGSEKQSGTCASSSSSSKCCVPTSCTPTNITPPPSDPGTPVPSSTASLDYTPLENLPGFEDQGGDFGSYFKSLYLLALWIVGISALFMLVVGGFLYLSSAGNTATLGFAKKTIYAALIGLVIALISWLLLDTINSDLTNLKLSGLQGAVGGGSAPGTGTPRAGTGPGGSPTPGTYTDAEARAALSAAGIGVKENNTSLEKIPKAAIDNLIAIKNECSCTVFVTGGTETAGHASHGPGKPIVDLRQDPALGNFLYSKAGGSGNATITKSPGFGISKMCVTREWEKLTYNCGNYREPSKSPHYHLVF